MLPVCLKIQNPSFEVGAEEDDDFPASWMLSPAGSFWRFPEDAEYAGPDEAADGSHYVIAIGEGRPLELTQTLAQVFEPGSVYTLNVEIGMADLTGMPTGFMAPHNGYTGVQMTVG